MKNPLSASTPSLNSSQRLETFDEKTHRFNAYADIPTRDGRVFEVQEPRVLTDFDWGIVYFAEMDLLERCGQYILPFKVAIHWEEMFGDDRLPSESTLFRLARTSIGIYLESHRIARGLSCHTHTIRLRLPECAPRQQIHIHNY